jgi:transcriptional regulator with XRE-family HTH domain
LDKNSDKLKNRWRNNQMAERINQHLNPIVGSNIRRLRKENDMKAVDVIAQLQLMGVNVTTGIFSKVEHGLNNPTVDMLIALTKIFRCDFNEFFK